MNHAIAVILLVVAITATATSNMAAQATGAKPAPLDQFDLGSFVVETFGNTTNYQDRLRQRKSFYKISIRSKLTQDSSPLYTFKITNLEELVRCENLTLEQPDVEPLIDCRPLQSYVITDGLQVPIDQSNRHAMYTHRQSLRIKQRGFRDHDDRLGPLVSFGYRLRDDVARSRIEAFQQGVAKFKEQDFVGIYMEVTRGPVKCNLNVFGSTNTTGFTSSPVEFGFNDFANGFSLSIEDVNCVDTDTLLPVALHGDLKLIYQKEFPFLHLNHRLFTHPMKEFFEFDSKVRQTRDESNLNSYNTSIDINSKSAFVNNLNFNLDQLFVNEDLSFRWEKMIFLHPQLVAAVNANRTLDSFIKTLLVYLPENIPTGKYIVKKPIFSVIFDDYKNQDEVGLSFRVNRDYLNSIFSTSQDSKLEEQLKMQHQHQEL